MGRVFRQDGPIRILSVLEPLSGTRPAAARELRVRGAVSRQLAEPRAAARVVGRRVLRGLVPRRVFRVPPRARGSARSRGRRRRGAHRLCDRVLCRVPRRPLDYGDGPLVSFSPLRHRTDARAAGVAMEEHRARRGDVRSRDRWTSRAGLPRPRARDRVLRRAARLRAPASRGGDGDRSRPVLRWPPRRAGLADVRRVRLARRLRRPRIRDRHAPLSAGRARAHGVPVRLRTAQHGHLGGAVLDDGLGARGGDVPRGGGSGRGRPPASHRARRVDVGDAGRRGEDLRRSVDQ